MIFGGNGIIGFAGRRGRCPLHAVHRMTYFICRVGAMPLPYNGQYKLQQIPNTLSKNNPLTPHSKTKSRGFTLCFTVFTLFEFADFFCPHSHFFADFNVLRTFAFAGAAAYAVCRLCIFLFKGFLGVVFAFENLKF